MADDKKSFILYSDLISIVEKLIQKDRENKTNYSGELFYHILQYVNDKNPIPIDFIVEMAFEPIKQQLKRDLKKYEIIREKRAKAGLASAEKRKQNATNPTYVDNCKERSTLSTVTDNDNVNDTVNVTVNDNVINSVSVIEKSPTQNFSSYGKQPIDTLKKNCAGYSQWLTVICKKNSLTMDRVLEWLDSFELHLLGKGTNEETESEFKRYFNSWISSEIRQGRKPKIEAGKQKITSTQDALLIAKQIRDAKFGNTNI